MATPLLHTKIFIPRPSPRVVHRPALVDRLQEGTMGKLTLLSAPAGFGKTTLLSQWIADRNPDVAWVSLNEGDNDLRRFLAYLVAALKQVEVTIDEDNLSPLISPDAVEVEAIGTSIINQILQVEQRIILVLDDYHSITTQSVHDLIEFLLQNMPHNLHLILATRADPPLRLGKLRVGGDLAEFRTADLRFQGEWVETYLKEVHGLTLSPEDSKKLLHRTEGWFAGLQLASLALKNAEDVHGFIDRFSGGHDYVAEYLTDEVFRGQTPEVRDFLLSSSILDRFSASVCDFVREANDSLSILKQLNAANIFIVSLDDESLWFRYHHLFADLLQKRLLETQTEATVLALNDRASKWFEGQDLVPEAIDYALRGQMHERALDMLEGIVEVLIRRSETDTFMQWADQLPEGLITTRPLLAVFYAWILLIRGEDPGLPDSILKELAPQDDAMAGKIHAVQSVNAIFSHRDPPASEAQARKALELLPEEDDFFRNMAVFNLSAAYYLQGKNAEGLEMLYEAAKMGRNTGNVLLAVTALCRIASIATQAGDLFEAKRLFDQALDLAKDKEGYILPVAFAAKLGLGKIYHEWNEPEKARLHLEDALRKGAQWKISHAIEAYDTLAFVQEYLGNSAEAEELLGKAGALASQTEITQLDDAYIAAQTALLSVRQGRIEDATIWASARAIDQELKAEAAAELSLGGGIIRLFELMVYSRILLAENRPGDALPILDGLDVDGNEHFPMSKRIEYSILQSLAHKRLDQHREALAKLRYSLELAQPGNEIRPFMEEGRSLFDLLKQLEREPGTETFHSRIMKSFEARHPKQADRDGSGVLVEPLTDREMRVLQYMLTELTVPEIAEQLFIAESTVRTHIKNLYGKLGAHSRFEAVTRAKELDLL